MFRKNFNNPTAKFLRLFFRFGIIAVVVLGTFPPGIAQADVVNQSSLAAEQIMVEPVNLPPVSDLDQAWTHPASVAEDSPMQVPPPPMSMRYPNRNKPPYPPMQEMEKDLFSFERSVESSQTETAQALSSGAWSIPSGIDPRSLPAGITVDLTYDVVMGFVDPGEAINVTLGTEGYGAAVADGVGFFWTPIWHNTDGYQLGIDCGDTINIVIGTDPAIENVPPCLTGGIDVLNDEVEGSIPGDMGGTSVTATLGLFDFYFLSGALPPTPGSPQVTGSTAGDGSFTLSFTGIADMGAESLVSLDIDLDSVNVRSYLYPESPVFIFLPTCRRASIFNG